MDPARPADLRAAELRAEPNALKRPGKALGPGLLTGRRLLELTVGLVGAHVLDPDTHGAQARQCLRRVEVLVTVPAVPATRVAGDRADDPDLLVGAQCRLTQPAAPGHILDRESCRASSKPNLKRLSAQRRQAIRFPDIEE